MDTVDRPKLEPRFLFHAWYLDAAFDRFIARPSTALATFSATVIDTRSTIFPRFGLGQSAPAVGGPGQRFGDHDQQKLVDSQADVGGVRSEQTVAAVW